MNATEPACLAWLPLIARPRPPALPLDTRIRELTRLASRADQGTVRERATSAAAVLNNLALTASDCGLPDLARELCHHQYQAFSRHLPLPPWAVHLALQPILNISRQLIREGHGESALTMLRDLHHAAARLQAVTVDGTLVDFAELADSSNGRKEAVTMTWTALLADGTRALASAGRWQEAAEHARAHRGTGARLLDGRQAAVLALLAGGQAAKATLLVEQTVVTEPWEHAVQALLRVLCHRAAGHDPQPATTAMITAARTLAQAPADGTTLTRARIGLTALSLAPADIDDTEQRLLCTALSAAGKADGYVARDLLTSTQFTTTLTNGEHSALWQMIRACGLNAGMIPSQFDEPFATAVDRITRILNESGALSDTA